MGDEMGGHLVSGHVDGCAKVSKIETIKDSHKFTFVTEKDLLRFVAKKGSITLDGVSLTVNEVNKNSFSVNLIEHTVKNTRFQVAKVGDFVNLEIDLLARYLERILAVK
jgi:riboflavin synthase